MCNYRGKVGPEDIVIGSTYPLTRQSCIVVLVQCFIRRKDQVVCHMWDSEAKTISPHIRRDEDLKSYAERA